MMVELIAKGLGITALIIVVIGLAFGWVLLWGWVAFLIYRSFAPETWPQLGLWTATGIVLLASILLGGAGGSARSS